MTNPLFGLASSAFGIFAQSIEHFNNKEHQHTVRFRSQMAAVKNGSECFQNIVTAYQQYQIIAAEEHTKRRDIKAWEKTTLKEIEKQREILLAFLDRSFDERAENFRDLFGALDQAIASNNNEGLSMILNKITELAQSSPFKDLADLSKVQAALNDPNHEWKF